ncbi:MAG TPA: dethiobiotin synthase [Rhizomicrobium sp.]|nr:dethiobiotin synthase [Rhizomicrobium sp.]
MSAYFVTATGTDIGKTFVTAGLIRHLRAAGRPVGALKPVVSGFDIATAAISDPGVLLEALDEPLTEESLARLSPWQFAAPLSPDMAAAREGRSIGFDDLVALCRNALAGAPENFFIEGVGGIMVPLDGAHTVLDWARALGLPLIVVTGSYLGSISHTLTTLKVAADAGLAVAALVVNETGDGAVPLDETVATMKRFAPGIPVATIARVKAPVGARADFAALARLLALDRA